VDSKQKTSNFTQRLPQATFEVLFSDLVLIHVVLVSILVSKGGISTKWQQSTKSFWQQLAITG